MNCKPLAVASLIVLLFVCAGLEGGGLSTGQALALSMPVGGLLLWSMQQTDWWEP